MDLQQKIVVVTGASAGLGADFSETLVERGAKVYGLARRQDRLDRLAERIGSGFTGLTCDVCR